MTKHQSISETWTARGHWISLPIALISLIGSASAVAGLCFAQTTPSAPSSQVQDPQDAASAPSGAVAKGIIKGRITADETGKPVEGAKLRVHVAGESQERSWLELSSDKDGQFSREVPLGDISLFGLFSPPGYYFQDEKSYDSLLLTKKEPVIVRNFALKSGRPWNVELVDYKGVQGKAPYITWTHDPQGSTSQKGGKSTVMGNAQGQAVLAVPAEGGQFTIRASESHFPPRFEIPEVRLKMERGFDPSQIAGEPERIAGANEIQLKDRDGRSATLSGGEVVWNEGQAVIRIPCKVMPKSRAFRVVGAVQDELAKPISQAKVTAAFISRDSEHASHTSHLIAYCEADGRFVIPEVLLPTNYLDGNYRMNLVVTKPGFSALETKPMNLPELQKSGVADFGVIKLSTEKILKGKVVDVRGEPVQGAVIRPCGIAVGCVFAHGHLTCRSDAEGRFQIPQLSYGKILFLANYGDSHCNEEFTFAETTGDLILTVRPAQKGITSLDSILSWFGLIPPDGWFSLVPPLDR